MDRLLAETDRRLAAARTAAPPASRRPPLLPTSAVAGAGRSAPSRLLASLWRFLGLGSAPDTSSSATSAAAAAARRKSLHRTASGGLYASTSSSSSSFSGSHPGSLRRALLALTRSRVAVLVATILFLYLVGPFLLSRFLGLHLHNDTDRHVHDAEAADLAFATTIFRTTTVTRRRGAGVGGGIDGLADDDDDDNDEPPATVTVTVVPPGFDEHVVELSALKARLAESDDSLLQCGREKRRLTESCAIEFNRRPPPDPQGHHHGGGDVQTPPQQPASSSSRRRILLLVETPPRAFMRRALIRAASTAASLARASAMFTVDLFFVSARADDTNDAVVSPSSQQWDRETMAALAVLESRSHADVLFLPSDPSDADAATFDTTAGRPPPLSTALRVIDRMAATAANSGVDAPAWARLATLAVSPDLSFLFWAADRTAVHVDALVQRVARFPLSGFVVGRSGVDASGASAMEDSAFFGVSWDRVNLTAGASAASRVLLSQDAKGTQQFVALSADDYVSVPDSAAVASAPSVAAAIPPLALAVELSAATTAAGSSAADDAAVDAWFTRTLAAFAAPSIPEKR